MRACVRESFSSVDQACWEMENRLSEGTAGDGRTRESRGERRSCSRGRWYRGGQSPRPLGGGRGNAPNLWKWRRQGNVCVDISTPGRVAVGGGGGAMTLPPSPRRREPVAEENGVRSGPPHRHVRSLWTQRTAARAVPLGRGRGTPRDGFRSSEAEGDPHVTQKRGAQDGALESSDA